MEAHFMVSYDAVMASQSAFRAAACLPLAALVPAESGQCWEQLALPLSPPSATASSIGNSILS